MSRRQRYTTLIFFTEGRLLKEPFWSMPLRWKKRLLRKPSRGLLWSHYWAWLTRTLTMSNYAHVCICADGVIVEIAANRPTQFWPLLGFAMEYPAVSGMFTIKTPISVDMIRYETPRRPPSPWRSILKWLTGGMVVTSWDCVDLAKDALAQIGVTVPHRVFSPGGLHKWLKGQGYEWTQFPPDRFASSR